MKRKAKKMTANWHLYTYLIDSIPHLLVSPHPLKLSGELPKKDSGKQWPVLGPQAK